MKAIILAGNTKSTAICWLNTTAKKFKLSTSAPVVTDDITGATRINALNALVNYMKKISENIKFKKDQEISGEQKETQEKPEYPEYQEKYQEPIIVYAIQALSDFIINKTALYWLSSDGKMLNGTPVNPKELKLWDEFYDLMKELEPILIFKGIQETKIDPNFRYKITEDKRILNTYATQVWDMVNTHKETYEQINDEEAFI